MRVGHNFVQNLLNSFTRDQNFWHNVHQPLCVTCTLSKKQILLRNFKSLDWKFCTELCIKNVKNIQKNFKFSCFVFISPKFAQILICYDQSCDYMIGAFRNSGVVSHVRCHIFVLSFSLSFFGQSCGASRWRDCYQWAYPN